MKHKSNRQIFQRFQGFLIAILGLFILLVAGQFLWEKFQNREEIARLLPLDQTVGFLELNYDSSNPANQQLLSKFSSQLEIAKSFIPSVDLAEKMWTGKAGIAFLQSVNGQQLSPVILVKFNDYTKVQDWLVSMQIDSKQDPIVEDQLYGQKLISFKKGQQFNLLISGNFLVFAEQKQTLAEIAKTASGNSVNLYQSPKYNQIYSALPQQNLAFIYLDSTKLWQSLNKLPNFLDKRLAEFQLFYPFLKLFSSEALAINAEIENQKLILLAKQLSSFEKNELPAPDFFQTDYFYKGNLDKFLSENSLFNFRGVNLLDQKNKLEAYFQSKSELENLLFSGSLEQLRQNFLSNNLTSKDQVDLDQDFFPLFQDEYLFFLTPSENNQLDFNLALINDKPENAQLKFQKILRQFAVKILAETSTKIVSKTLPDGTNSEEEISEIGLPAADQSLDMQGQTIQAINLGARQIFLATKANYLLASTSRKQLESMMGIATATLEQSTPGDELQFKSTELWQVNLNWLMSISNTASKVPFKLPFSQLKGSRKFTEIGILSTYQLY